ncbi:MAG: hypothetical protein NTV88_05890 [Candidatus Micrarchaeota archaeon]|nr:hypothetical protein [Candidatus Micrarchaeota archaeon]
MDYKPLNQPTKLQNFASTAKKFARTVWRNKKYAVPIVFLSLALAVEGCNYQAQNNRIQVPAENKGASQLQDKKADVKLFGNVLGIVSASKKAVLLDDNSLSGYLGEINASTIAGSQLSVRLRESGLTEIQLDPTGATGMILIFCSQNGEIAISTVKNQQSD